MKDWAHREALAFWRHEIDGFDVLVPVADEPLGLRDPDKLTNRLIYMRGDILFVSDTDEMLTITVDRIKELDKGDIIDG